MKVLVVTPYYYPKIGGLENYARQLNRALQQQERWEVVVVTSNHEGTRTYVDNVDGVKVYRLGTLLKFSNTPLSPLWPFQMRAVIRRERPDLIVAHSPVPSMADAAALAAGKTPFVVVYHAATLLKGGSRLFNIVAKVYGLYEQVTFWRARRIVAVSDYVKASLGERLQRKTVVIPNAVWEHEIKPRRNSSGTELLFIGSLDRTHAWKGLDHLIEAIRVYVERYGNRVHLTVVGDGNYREQYEAHAKQAGVAANVTFVGAKVGAEKDAIITAASALVMYPTTANDAFPTVLLEAWAKGVPAVSAAIGPLPSLIHDGQDGFLVPPHDPEALAEVLHKVLTAPSSLHKTVTANAVQRTRAHYTWERQARAMVRLAREITK